MSQKTENTLDQESTTDAEDPGSGKSTADAAEEILVGEILDAEPEAVDEGEVSENPSENEDIPEISLTGEDGSDAPLINLDGFTKPQPKDEVSSKPSSAEPSLEELYNAALEKAEANRNDYLRSVADMQNLRKRTARDVKQARSFAIEGFARDLLPVADNMIRALAALADSDDPAVKSLFDGVEMVQKELDRAFDKHGLTKIEALNAKFDPNLHQAVVQIEDPDAEPGQVVQEMQVGYTLNDRLLRPAMVGVAKS
jgi:molecular chaperone GrpE